MQMAHVVGVPKRDPCQKCKLPVFLAERLTVGKRVYHRTCLKCARCKSQLTPGSFYETEVDNEYCCETCPDEENAMQVQNIGLDADDGAAVTSSDVVQLRQPREELQPPLAEAATTKPRTVRRSIADRLAFFEQSKSGGATAAITTSTTTAATLSDSKLLQKSVSDEEKSQSLKRIGQNSSLPYYKLNSSLSSFLTGTVAPSKDAAEGVLECEDTSTSATDTISKQTDDKTSSLSDSEGDGEDLSLELPRPELPTTQPPMQQVTRTELGSDEVELKIIEDADQQSTQLFTARAQVQLINNQSECEEIVLKIEESENESETGAEGEKSRDENKLRDQISEHSNREEVREATSIKQKSELKLKLSAERNPTTDYINNNHDNSNHHVAAEHIEASAIEQHGFDDVTFKLNSRLEPNDSNCLTKEEILQKIDVQQMSPKDDEEENKASNVEIESNKSTTKREIVSPKSTADPVNAAVENVEFRTKPTTAATDSSTKKSQGPSVQLSPVDEDIETTRRLSVVRARLHQFEVNANNIVVPDLDKNTLKSNDVDTKVNTINSSTDKNKIEGVENQECEENVLKAIEVLINHMETEEILKQVPEDDNDKEMIATKEDAITIEAIEKEKIPMEIDEDGQEEKEQMEAEQEIEVLLPETEKLITPTERTVQSPAEKDFANSENTLDTIEETTTVTTIANRKGEEEGKESAPKPQTSTIERPQIVVTPTKSSTLNIKDYPNDLNPFQSDDESDKENSDVVMRPPSPASHSTPQKKSIPPKQANLNPFDSSDDEIELEKSVASSAATTPSSGKVPPPRPPPPRISRNPFGEETEENLDFSRRSSLTSSISRKTPVPTPRHNRSLSQNLTPEPIPRLSSSSRATAAAQQTHSTLKTSSVLHNASDYYGSANSLSTPHSLYRNSDIRGSNNSLASSAGGTIRSRKQRRAPAPPPHPTVKELFPPAGAENSSINSNSQPSTPGSSTVGTPKQGRKKRHAPAPPKPARLDPTLHPNITVQEQQQLPHQHQDTQSKNSFSYPLQSELDSKLSDEEKALLEGNHHLLRHDQGDDEKINLKISSAISKRSSRRLIPLDASLLLDEDDRKEGNSNASRGYDGGKSDDLKHQEYEEELNVVYRRKIIPPPLETPTHEGNPLLDELNSSAHIIEHNRQLEKLKDNKEAKNRNRQSQISVTSSGAEDSDPSLYNNKSAHGKWKRRKGPAPALPIPPRKVLQMLPLQEIKHELEIIEVQQQGLEKQGVVLEKMIRDRCEGANGELLSIVGGADGDGEGGVMDDGRGSLMAVTENSKEVEDLILQLFELVNEKNELFRRQAELMYLRRQHRLEQEQADIEYEIRVLMAQPERNKTDSDKAREEALIARLVEVVQLRNEVVECLEMDRLREAEEDMSIKRRLELHTAQREGDGGGVDSTKTTLTKLSKKEKKKQKETKKLVKSKKLDVDKDADETELKTKKKKKKFIF